MRLHPAGFSSMESAQAFARLVRAATGARVEVVEVPECPGWVHLKIPASIQRRFDDLRAGWEAALTTEVDLREARRWESETTDEQVDRLRKAHYPVIGLSAGQTAFLEEARGGQASPWNHSSYAVASMKRMGFVEPVVTGARGKGQSTRYKLTGAGERALAGDFSK